MSNKSMCRFSVIQAILQHKTVCYITSKWYVGWDASKKRFYRLNVLTGELHGVTDFSMCFIHVGGVGSDD